MRRWLILITTYFVMLTIGFAGRIYTLPVLIAPKAPDTAALQMIANETLYSGTWFAILKSATCFIGEKGKSGSRAIGSDTLGVSPLDRTTDTTSPHVSPTRRGLSSNQGQIGPRG